MSAFLFGGTNQFRVRAALASGCALALLPGCRMPVLQTAVFASVRKPTARTASVDSTKEMADLLQSIARTIAPGELAFINNEDRVRALQAAMERAPDTVNREMIRPYYASELLSAGHTQMALDELDRVERWLKSEGMWDSRKYGVQLLKATAYMRLGEQQNCCAVNTADSCLVPIRGAGVHTKQEGSAHAMQLFEEILQDHPDDVRVRWLLNIAAMTLGKYPEGVPSKWRVSPKAFHSDYDIKRFPNIASQVGLNLLGHAGGAIVDDLDGDGYLDVMVSGIGFQDQLRFFHNNGDATFTERTKQAKLTGEMGGLNLLQADYDNDGHTDVLVLRGGWMGTAGRFPSSLLHNNGDGTFTDVTKQSGLNIVGPTQTAVWLDYNNDGLLDLFVGYESTPGNIHPCALYRNNGDGTFTDVAAQAGVDFVGFVKGVVSVDYDNDGWPDLFVSAMGRKVLYHNNHNGTFTDVTEKAGISGPVHSFGAFFFDYDNDGWPDLFIMDYDPRDVTNVMRDIQGMPVNCDRSHLYHNNHNGTFTDVSHAAHLDRVILGMGLNFGDLDNDGYPDIYAGTGNPELTALIPNRMFRNVGGKYFQEVTTSGDFGHLQKGHGVAFADINNDGNQDVFEEMGGALSGDVAYSALYANPGHGNHWITLKLQGVQTNRSAIGAHIKVTVNTRRGARSIYKTVGSGGSFGCNPLRAEIGLGQALAIQKVEIYWPVSRKTQTLTGLHLDRFYAVREDQDRAVPVHLKATPWPVAIARAGRIDVPYSPIRTRPPGRPRHAGQRLSLKWEQH